MGKQDLVPICSVEAVSTIRDENVGQQKLSRQKKTHPSYTDD